MFEVDYDRVPTEEDIEQVKKTIEQLQKKIDDMRVRIDSHKKEESLAKQYKKMNDEMIELVFDEDTDGIYFEFNDRKYELNDFASVHNNPWFSDLEFPSFIDGISKDSSDSICVAVYGDFGVDVYRRVNE